MFKRIFTSTTWIVLLFAAFSTYFAVWANTTVEGLELHRRIGLVVFSGIAWFICIRWIQAMYDYARSVAYTTKHGIVVHDDGGYIPSQQDFEQVVDRTISLWLQVPGFNDDAINKRLKNTYVWIKPTPFQLHGKGPKFAGLAKPMTKRIAVGVGPAGIRVSALAHELGHVIGKVNDPDLRELSGKYGVPF